MDQADRILDLAQRAHELYLSQQDNHERRKLVDSIISKVVISGRKAVLNLREPFQTLSKLALRANSGCGKEGWYPSCYP